jgi:hypothetical protein
VKLGVSREESNMECRKTSRYHLVPQQNSEIAFAVLAIVHMLLHIQIGLNCFDLCELCTTLEHYKAAQLDSSTWFLQAHFRNALHSD